MSLEFRVQSSEFRVLAALLISAFIIQHSSFAHAVQVRWFAESSRPTKNVIQVFRGESIYLTPIMQSYGDLIEDISSATLYWQTNGMDNSWWSKPAAVTNGQITAMFGPENDVGAAQYDFFIGSASDEGSSYRAYGTFKMQFSPGYIPFTLPDPDIYPTLAAVLAPYVVDLMPAFDPSILTNISISAVNSNTAAIAVLQTNRTDKLWGSPTNYVDGCGVVYELVLIPDAWIVTETDGGGFTFIGQEWILNEDEILLQENLTRRNYYPVTKPPEYNSGWLESWTHINDNKFSAAINMNLSGYYGMINGALSPQQITLTDFAGGVTITLLHREASHAVRVSDRFATTNELAAALAEEITGASTQSLSSVLSYGNHSDTNVPAFDTNAVISVRAPDADKTALYGSGSTRPGVEAYSTYAPAIIARSATGPAALLIQGPVSNSVGAEVTGILKITDEPTANEGAGQPGAINLGGRSITSWDEIEAQIDAGDIAALNAWGLRLPDGSANAASDTAVVINSPMIIASGLGFETSGNYAVCITAGAEMQVVTNGGWVCIKPSSWSDGIGFRTISMTVPAVPNSFNVFGGGQTNGYARIKFPYLAGETNAPPVCYSTDLITWANAPEQVATQDGANWTVTVVADQPKMFFKGVGRTGAADRIYSAYPHTFDAGVAVGTMLPVVYNAVITISHDGKTYRIPAEEQ